MKYRTIITLLIITLCLYSPFFILPRIIKIDSIRCSTQFGQCGDAFEDLYLEEDKVNLLVAREMLEGKIKADFRIDKSSVRYSFPSTLDVSIVMREPRFGLKRDDSSGVGLVDREGMVILFEDKTALPTLNVDDVPNVGEHIPDKYIFALSVVDRFFRYYDVKSADYSDHKLTMYLNNYPRLIFPETGDAELLTGSASFILSRLKQQPEDFRIESTEQIQEIDLRFKNPVLRKG